MSRTKNISVVTIGYNKFAFEDAQTAFELMAIMSRAVQVEEKSYGMEKMTECTHFLDDSRELPELKFVDARRFNPEETAAEVKARYEREQKDREDLNQQFREAPPALPAPTDEIPF